MMSKWAARMIMFKWGPEVGVVRTNQKKTSEEVHPPKFTRWWQLKDFGIFSPKIGEEWTQFDEHIFQMGWFNHQPV